MVTVLFLVAIGSFALMGAFLWILSARHARARRAADTAGDAERPPASSAPGIGDE